MNTRKQRRDLIAEGQHQHYTVAVQIFERERTSLIVDDVQHVAATSPEQALRRAGMRLAHKLKGLTDTDKNNGTDNT